MILRYKVTKFYTKMLPRFRTMLIEMIAMISHPMTFLDAISGTKSVWVITMLYKSSIVYSFSMSNMFSKLLVSGLK